MGLCARRLGQALLGPLLLLAISVPLLAAGPEVKEAEDELKKAINGSDLEAADRAIAKLRAAGGAPAVKTLVGIAQKIPAGQESTYWRLVNGAASFRDDGGLEELAKTLLDAKNIAIARDILFALGNNRAPKVATVVYAPLLEKGPDELKLMAADNVCGIEFVEAVDVIIAAFKREEKKKGEVTTRLLAGLKWLTGADCGTGDSWEAWWKAGGRAAGLKGRERRSESTGTVVDEVEGPRGDDLNTLERLPKERIAVIVADCPKNKRNGGGKACNFDDMDKLLEEMKIPHIVINKSDLESGKATLDKTMAILLTCTQINDHCVCEKCTPSGANAGNRMSQCSGCNVHDSVKHKLSAKTAKMIRDWVERGGYLFSEDWGMADVGEDWSFDATTGKQKPSQSSWGKFVKNGKMMKERTVPCSPSRGKTSHALLRGVFIDPAAKAVVVNGGDAGGEGGGTVVREPAPMDNVKIQRNWKIDSDSPYIEVIDKNAVTVLMESDVLAKEGHSAVAVTFLPAGSSETGATTGRPDKLVGGRVLHVLSHFGKQESKEDEFALQNMLLNFLVEANRRYKGGK